MPPGRATRVLNRSVAALVCAGLALAPPAAADSLAYVKDHNVWLANPDGSGQYQVTLDGTAGAPYDTPSQSDDGTVVAIRATPGQRRQIYRMTQSGRLLNAPIDTPAPGTGAIDGKVSPDGKLVAYWFVTTVSDPLCPFCVNTSNRALLSRSDSFTNADAVGTPNTGGWPSWVTNDTIVVGSGSATQWYYRIGMPEAAEWFNDSQVTGEIVSLLDAEAAPGGDRLAVVRGDNQESILILRMNGPPPATPSIANGQCAGFQQPTGKFADPTWSSDGTLLAWQEGDGVWVATIAADLANCAGFGAPGPAHPRGRLARPQPGGPRAGPAPAVRQPRQPGPLQGGRPGLLPAQARPGRRLGLHGAGQLRDERRAGAPAAEGERAATQAEGRARLHGAGRRHARRSASPPALGP